MLWCGRAGSGETCKPQERSAMGGPQAYGRFDRWNHGVYGICVHCSALFKDDTSAEWRRRFEKCRK